MFNHLDREQKYILGVLTLINFLNYVDRQVIFPLFSSIQSEFQISDFELGLLGTLFMLIHSLASVPLGILADKYPRKMIISVGVFFWSIVTFLSGLTRNFQQLLMLRSLVGIGEASYAPAATAIISETFPQKMRATVQGVFNIGMFAGGTFGIVLGGMVAYYFHSNWRIAFFIVAVPGMLLAYLAARLKTRNQAMHHQLPRQGLAILMGNRAYLWLLVSGILVTFAAGAFLSWGIEFIHRYKGYNLRDASLILGSTMLVAGITGVILGSYLSDKAYARLCWGRCGVIAASLILAGPIIFFGIHQENELLFILCFFFGIALACFYHGPVTAVIHDIVPQNIWATAFAVYLLVIHLLGDTLSPVIIGLISDHKDLITGMELSAIFVFASGLTFIPVCLSIKNQSPKV